MAFSRLIENLFQLGQFPGRVASLGHLIIRLGIGIWMLNRCWGHLVGGQSVWEELGSSMAYLGITFFPGMWGLFAALSENIGSLLFILGLMTRVTSFFLFFTMTVAVVMHMNQGQDPSLPLILAIVYFAFIFIGAGRISIDYWIGDRSGTPGATEEY